MVMVSKGRRFKQFLRPEERVVFDDLVTQCKIYASAAGVLASPVKEIPLLLSMISAQHKRLLELEKRMNNPASNGAARQSRELND